MKRLIFLMLALLVAGSASAATKVQVMTDGVIDTDRLKTIPLLYETDPASPVLGQIWWNNATNQLKVAGALGVYAFNATSLVEWDTTPESFSFTDVANATTSTVYTSAPIMVSGINWPSAISVSGDASAKYSVNNATAVSTNGTVEAGDEVRAVVTSSASDATAVNATVTIGGVSDAFVVTTAAASVATYLVDEDFEGAGAPSGWSSTAATTNYDYTTTVLEGSESLFFNRSDASERAVTVAFENTSTTVYGAFKWQHGVAMDGDRKIFTVGNAYLKALLGGELDASISGTTDGVADGTLTISHNTLYYIWFKVNTNNGSGGSTFDVYVSTNNTKPESPETATIRSATWDAPTSISFAVQFNSQILLDSVKISTEDFPVLE